MTRTLVSVHYGLGPQVPFLDVYVECDNRLFLTPPAIRWSSHGHAAAARQCLDTFMGEVLRCATSRSATHQAKGLSLLQQLHEPNETRLGMSAAGVAGHGFGDGMGEMLWDELRRNPVCRAAVLQRLEDMAVFVDGVGDDLVSDLTTRVVFEVLADFTSQMMGTYPSLAAHTSTEPSPVWDPVSLDWTTKTFVLPFVAGRQLLLVPEDWVYWRQLLDPDAFYNRHSTRTVQEERTTQDRSGRRLRPSKRSLGQEFPHHKGLNVKQAVAYTERGQHLLEQYRSEVHMEFEPLGPDERYRRL